MLLLICAQVYEYLVFQVLCSPSLFFYFLILAPSKATSAVTARNSTSLTISLGTETSETTVDFDILYQLSDGTGSVVNDSEEEAPSHVLSPLSSCTSYNYTVNPYTVGAPAAYGRILGEAVVVGDEFTCKNRCYPRSISVFFCFIKLCFSTRYSEKLIFESS